MSTPACWHCGEPLPADAPRAVVAGVPHPVCCHGCRAAAEWIDRLGLTDYYRFRTAPAERPVGPSTAAAWADAELARHAQRTLPDGSRAVGLLIDGVRCSACVWLIERSLGAAPGVTRVQVNASARRAHITFDPAHTDLPHILTVLERIGYRALPLDAQALNDVRQHEARDALKRLLVAGFGTMQAMMYAAALYLGAFTAMDPPTRAAMRWLGLLVATPVVFYAARPFFAGAWRSLRAGSAGMDVPIALAIALIFGASFAEALRGGGEVYFDSVSMFVFFLLVGRYLEMRARHHAACLSDALVRLTPAWADRFDAAGKLERVAATQLRAGDLVLVAAGAAIPADGALESTAGTVNEALLTGESAPVRKVWGERLVAGSLVTDGPLRLRVRHVGSETVLAGIIALVTRAQAERPRLASAGDRAARRFVARVLALAALTAVGWSFIDPARAFTATLAVLVVSCPCAFALAVPAALTRALAVLARRGVLVVHADAIEQLATATHVIFDKTGTLTRSGLRLDRVTPVPPCTAGEARRIAATLARGNTHPVARALAAPEMRDHDVQVEGLRAEAGGGLEGVIGGRRWRLGHAAFALPAGQADPADPDVILADERGCVARFSLAEKVRVDALETVAALVHDGLAVEVLSGDAPARVAAVARRLGIREWRARQRPADKLARLQALRTAGARIIAVGDGTNDAPVLAGADVAVTLANGTDLAQASSDVVLGGQRLDGLVEARVVAQHTLAVLRQNQRWALFYNLVAVPFAALGLVPPWLAALGMSLSSIGVVLNALRIGTTTRDNPAAAAAPRIAEAGT